MKINKNLYFKNLTGYKISNSHFELGSNLHITDYYYAKRIFYNSFYTNRFAFIIVQSILEDYQDLINSANKKNTKISLIGHEIYSDLLLSNIRKMLNDYIHDYLKIEKDLFNHDIFTKDNLFLKNGDKVSEDIIFITPISTTFSTSIKIQNEIIEVLKTELDKSNFKFHNLNYNCIFIRNKEINNKITYSHKNIEHSFGWINADFEKRIIKMKNCDSSDSQTNIVEQSFLIDLTSNWERIHECKSCFPTINKNEKCLIETKNNPVTPNVIFNYPKANIYNDINSKSIYNFIQFKDNNDNIICRKHFKINNNHFIYYIKAGSFLKQNKPIIIKWLKANQQKIGIFNDKSVVIITPSLTSNSGFVNLVNEHVFSDTATIIQYNPSEDYLFNFKFFYSKILENADYIIYVDDLLFSTSTFSDINFFIKNIKRKNNEYSDIDGTITLINRTGYYNYNKLINKFIKIKNDTKESDPLFLSFLNVTVTPLLHKNIYPFDNLSKKFEILSNNSGLDEMRFNFMNKKNHFAPIDLTKEFKDLNEYSKPNDLFQFIVANEFNKIFEYDKVSNSYLHDDLIKNSFEESNSKSYENIVKFISDSQDIEKFLIDYPNFNSDIKNSVYKICSKEPLIQFKNIKEAVFSWILNDLIESVNKINNNKKVSESFFDAKEDEQPINYSKYEEFCFLLKRAGKLKINYIYSIEVLKAIQKVLRGINKYKKINYFETIKSNGSLKIENNNNDKSLFNQNDPDQNTIISFKQNKAISSSEFITFFVGILQELIIDHESKSIQTVKNVKIIIDELNNKQHKNLKNTYNDDFMNLLRLMVYENTFVFHTASEKFLKKYNNLYFYDLEKTKTNEYQNDNLVNFKKEIDNYSKIYSFGNTAKMLSRIVKQFDSEILFTPDDVMYNSFVDMLTLKCVLKNDLNESKDNLVEVNEKIEIILDYCCKILNISEGGAFFALKHRNKLLSEENEIGENDFEIISEYFANEDLETEDGFSNFNFKNSILKKVFNEVKREDHKSPLSTFELSKEEKGDKKIHFIKNNQIDNNIVYESIEVKDNRFRNFFYLKITDLGDGKTYNPYAVICFYDNLDIEKKSKYIRFDPKRIRQLLLLRNDILSFITHHLNNDGLRAYIENRNKYLMSDATYHGFDTYIEQYNKKVLEIENPDLKEIFEILGQLIDNKNRILSYVKDYFDVNNSNKSEFLSFQEKETISVQHFKGEINKFMRVIFSKIELNEHDYIDLTNIILDLDGLSDKTNMKWYKFFYNEIIFEIFLNYRKIYNSFIDDSYKLKITITFEKVESSDYLSFKNNLYDFLPNEKPSKTTLNNIMLNKRQKNGLGLINTISELVNNKPCIIRTTNETFELLIPIEKR